MELALFLLIGAAVGWLCNTSGKEEGYALTSSILAAVIGSVLFGLLAQLLNFDADGGMVVQLLTATGGAFVGLVSGRALAS